MKRKLLTALALTMLGAGSVFAATYTPKYEVIEKADYPTTDVNVITYNILDYEPTANQGSKDVTSLLQNLLNAAGDAASYPSGDAQAYRQCGGVVYLPAGKYRINGKINVPRGTSLRGDWKKPVKGQAIEGTIIVAGNRYKGDTDETNGLFVMEPSTQISHLAIWYEDQDANNPSPYPPSIVYGKKGYFGNDYCNVRFVTLVNSYTGLIFSELNGGGCPNIFHLYGTPLNLGVAMDNIADVGRFDHLDFSPAYWAGSGLPNAADATNYTYNNATGFEMRRNDWSYCCNYTAEGYARGFWAKKSPERVGSSGTPNGHNYNMTFTNCKVGVYVTDSSGSGIMFTRVKTQGCEYGVEQAIGQGNPTQYLNCEISGRVKGLMVHSGVSNDAIIKFQNSTISGGTEIESAQFMADNCTFDGDVNIGALARCVFTSNTMRSGVFNNASLYECVVDHNKYSVPQLPDYPEELMEIPVTKPAKNQLFVVTNYGAEPKYIDKTEANNEVYNAKDNAPAIQQALNAAKNAGGGIVYLPSGHYRVNSNIVIPTGVELRGSADMASTPRGQGAILEVTVGEGSANGTPLITMEPKSGLRGISVNYPKQDASIFTEVAGSGAVLAHSVCTPKQYPYAVRGNADCYIVNLALRACYQGVDVFTNKCDRHYVDYISGHCFKNVIRIGGNSENGTVSNIQCNTIAYGAGDEWKFGLWPNSLHNKDNKHQDACYQQNYDELDFLVVGDCKKENLYNNFLFGSSIGMLFQSDGNGGPSFYSVGNAVDGVVNTFVFRAAAEDACMVNSQLVALDNGHSASFFTTESTFNKTINMFSTNNWGGGDTFAKIAGGNVNFILANLDQSGDKTTYAVSGNGKFKFVNANFKRNVNTNANKNVSVHNAIYTPVGTGNAASDFGEFHDVLAVAWKMINKTGFITRNGWHAIAFDDEYGQDETGKEQREDWRHAGDALASRAVDNDMDTRWSTKGSQARWGYYDEWANSKEPGKVDQVSWKSRPPQWFALFFNHDHTKAEHVNAMILDAGSSTSDGPAAWDLEVVDENGTFGWTAKMPSKNDKKGDEPSGMEYTVPDPTNVIYGHKWRKVASGAGAGGLLIAVFPEQDVTGLRMTQTGSKGNYWSINEVEVAMLHGVKVSGIDAVTMADDNMLLYVDRTLVISRNLFGSQDEVEVEIFDLNGRKVDGFFTSDNKADLSDLAAGTYVISARGDLKSSLKVLVK